MKKLSNLKSNFTKIDNRILQDENVSVEAKGVYAYMVSLPNDWRFTIKNISNALNIGEKKLNGIIKELLGHRLLKKWYYNDSQGYRRLEMCIYDYETRDNTDSLPAKKASRIDCVNSANNLSKSTTADKILPYQKGDLENISQGTDLQNTNSNEMPLNANENPTIPKGQVGTTIYITNKEKNLTKKESNKENKVFVFKTPKILDLQSSLELADDLFENAKNDFDNEIRNFWLQFINNKFAKLKELRKKMTDSMIQGNFNDLYKVKDLGIDLRERLKKASSESWRSFIFDSDKHNTFRNQNKKPDYNPRTGNTGESVFSDNPNDYINENMNGVTKIADGVFEADLFKLTGRKA